MSQHMPSASLSQTLWPAEGTTRFVRAAILVIIAIAALWASARLKVDIGPVPVTLQTLVVLAIGAAYGSRLGAGSVLAYLATGAAGLPVFAGTPEKGIGMAYMMGPTGGYLAGFVIAAFVAGWLAERGGDRHVVKMFAIMVVASALIYVPGVAWLAAFIGVEKALQFGLFPFIAGDLVKAVIAAGAFPAAWALVNRYEKPRA